MSKKIKDAAIPVEYTNKDGEVKTKWHNVGAIMEKADGSHFMLFDTTVNLAAFPKNSPNSTSILIGLFNPSEKIAR